MKIYDRRDKHYKAWRDELAQGFTAHSPGIWRHITGRMLGTEQHGFRLHKATKGRIKHRRVIFEGCPVFKQVAK